MNGLKATCKKCGCEVKIDCGDMTKAEAIEKMAKVEGYNCSGGMHVEIGMMMDYLTIVSEDIETLDEVKSDEDFKAELVAEYGAENVLTTSELPRDCDHCGYGYFKNSEYNFDRYDTPRGARFYVRRKI